MIVVIELFGIEAKEFDPQGSRAELILLWKETLLDRQRKVLSAIRKSTNNFRQIIVEIDVPLGTFLERRRCRIGWIAELKRKSWWWSGSRRRGRHYFLKDGQNRRFDLLQEMNEHNDVSITRDGSSTSITDITELKVQRWDQGIDISPSSTYFR